MTFVTKVPSISQNRAEKGETKNGRPGKKTGTGKGVFYIGSPKYR